MTISKLGTTDYGTQELQSTLKNSTPEDKTLSLTKKVELQNKVTQEMETEIHKTKPSNPSIDSKSVQIPKEEDPIQVLEKETSLLEASNVKDRSTEKKENYFDFTIWTSRENKQSTYYRERRKQQDPKFKSEVVGNSIKYRKERQEVSGESNMIIRAKSSKTKEKNKEKEDYFSDRAGRKPSTVLLTGAKVVQAKI
ncbi:26286_t:CDS:2, partial [Gigaspora rosea]